VKTIRAIIIDDEELARENLAMMVDEFCPEINIVAKAGNIDVAYEEIIKHDPDLIFLDIRMPSGTEGFDLLTKFNDPSFLVIFVTAFKDYAVEAMNANAIHYILKPIDINDLEAAVNKVSKLRHSIIENPEMKDDYIDSLKKVYQQFSNIRFNKISISHSKGIKLIDPSKILFVEAKSNCSNIVLTDGSNFLDTRTLGVYENFLPENMFFRIHRSYIVNLNFLEEYRRDRGNYAILKDGLKLPVSKKRVKDFVARIKSMGKV
jgi:two-component system LytT family response regulator